MELTGDASRELSRKLIDNYFKTVSYPYTRHHIDSYDQFLQQDLISIIRSHNPILILKDLINEKTNTYKYKVEIFVGGEDGNQIEIGTPTISLQDTDEVRVLYPNEARLRNLTYSSTIYTNIVVKITYTTVAGQVIDLSPEAFKKWPLFKIPITLKLSRFIFIVWPMGLASPNSSLATVVPIRTTFSRIFTSLSVKNLPAAGYAARIDS